MYYVLILNYHINLTCWMHLGINVNHCLFNWQFLATLCNLSLDHMVRPTSDKPSFWNNEDYAKIVNQSLNTVFLCLQSQFYQRLSQSAILPCSFQESKKLFRQSVTTIYIQTNHWENINCITLTYNTITTLKDHFLTRETLKGCPETKY